MQIKIKHFFLECKGSYGSYLNSLLMSFAMILLSVPLYGQQAARQITGVVTDVTGESLPGVSIIEKGTTNGIATNIDGQYVLNVADNNATVLVFSYVGFETQEIIIANKKVINISLTESSRKLDEVVVVGYGVQNKGSVVAAVVQRSQEELKQTYSGSDLTLALAGQVPGLVMLTSSGEPGGIELGSSASNMYIRGQTSWNNSSPLILVDGVERDMMTVDISEVSSISVLKDASATSVFGVRGANGVILVTTKRGESGKTRLNFTYKGSGLQMSKVPKIMNSYDAVSANNEIIEREVGLSPNSWNDYVPYWHVANFQQPIADDLKYIYPDVNWQKELFKPMAFSHNANINAQGGNKFIRYFGSLGYNHEGDIIKRFDNRKGYQPSFGYDRFNFRSNIDLSLTRTTNLAINLDGFFSLKRQTMSNNDTSSRSDFWQWRSLYGLPPNLYVVMHPDGYFGAFDGTGNNLVNPAAIFNSMGLRTTRTHRTNTLFELKQDLDFITKGLRVSAMLSLDSQVTTDFRWNDGNHARPREGNTAYKVVEWWKYTGPDQDPNEYTLYLPEGTGDFDWEQRLISINQENINITTNWRNALPVDRRMLYKFQLNYNRTFGKHDVTGAGIMEREENALGTQFKRYRENWIFRGTYNYDARYSFEFSGAYNGSEQFGPGYKFDFFPSVGLGWYVSNEKFFNIKWVDRLKLRFSSGKTGNDRLGNERWLYSTDYAYGGSSNLVNDTNGTSPYTHYTVSRMGNPYIQWENALQNNFGIDMGLFKNLLSLTVEIFNEDRTDQMIAGANRAIPAYFGFTPPPANLGRVKSKGFEIELRIDKRLPNLRLWSTLAISHNENKVIFRDDGQLLPDYRKQAGFPIGQQKRALHTGYIMQNWDDVYASIPTETLNDNKLPGYYDLIDFNADGIYKGADDGSIPIGYAETPQNIYTWTLGANYKGFNFMMQFYGVNNTNRWIGNNNWRDYTATLYAEFADYWSKDNPDAYAYLPRFRSQGPSYGHWNLYDGSYVRLRAAEIGYTVSKANWITRAGIDRFRIYLSGNDLFFWSRMIDDRETTFSSGSDTTGAYPRMKYYNLGFELTF